MQCIYLSHLDGDEYQAPVLGITFKPHNIVYLFSVLRYLCHPHPHNVNMNLNTSLLG